MAGYNDPVQRQLEWERRQTKRAQRDFNRGIQELSKLLGKLMHLLARATIMCLVNGTAFSLLIGIAELFITPSSLYSAALPVAHDHGIIYALGSHVLNLLSIPNSWGGYGIFSYIAGCLSVGFFTIFVVPIFLGMHVYASVVGPQSAGAVITIGVALAVVCALALYMINIAVGSLILAIIVAPFVRMVINAGLFGIQAKGRLSYRQTVTLILVYLAFRKRFSAVKQRYLTA